MLLAQQQRLGQPPSGALGQRQAPAIGQAHPQQRRRRRSRSAAPPRVAAQAGSPFRNGRPDGSGSPFASHAVAAGTALPTLPEDVLRQQQQDPQQEPHHAGQEQQAVPPLAVQQQELTALLQQLRGVETYEDKVRRLG